ncbi:hypothetical protein QE152_g24489 [Popillia japonica]|uniref:Uncharacterized protein n=1 Tax=Popillia japonica TaxID=7064 RepID=A0AAW1KBH8_POPJA
MLITTNTNSYMTRDEKDSRHFAKLKGILKQEQASSQRNRANTFGIQPEQAGSEAPTNQTVVPILTRQALPHQTSDTGIGPSTQQSMPIKPWIPAPRPSVLPVHCYYYYYGNKL